MLKKAYAPYVAELIGTYLLALSVSFAVGATLIISPPVMAGVTLGIVVYLVGGISGAHINPSITIAMLAIKKISATEAAKYIIAQLAGAVLALLTYRFMVGAALPAAGTEIYFNEYIAEILGTAMLGFGVTMVTLGKVDKSLSGIVVGGSLFIGIMLASAFSYGVLNPAVAVALHVVTPPYVVGPIIGATLGSMLAFGLAQAK